MKNSFMLWIFVYIFVMSYSQILLKFGTNQLGSIHITKFSDIIKLFFNVIKNPLIMLGIISMVVVFFVWIYVLSHFKLGLVFPMTALVYVLVALMSYYILGEKLSLYNYFGIVLVITGIVFLLYNN